jgi:hypothetical protein
MLMLKLMLMLTRRPPLVCTLHLHIVSTTHCRMVLLARARSLWMFAWGWVYSLFSDLHAREAAAMVPIRSFAALTLAAAHAATAGANTASSTTDSKQQQQQRVTAPPSPATEAAKAHNSSGTATATAGATADTKGDTAASDDAVATDVSGSASTESTTDSSSSSTKQRSSSVSVSPLSALSGMESHTKRASCMMDETITLLFAGQVR